MTKDDIIRMAREAGLPYIYQTGEVANLGLVERFASLVAAAEREACAKVCESKMPNPVQNWADSQIVNALRDCAEAIRARNT